MRQTALRCAQGAFYAHHVLATFLSSTLELTNLVDEFGGNLQIVTKESLEVKLPTIWTDEAAEVERVREESGSEEKKSEGRSQRRERVRREEVRGKKSEKRKSQKSEEKKSEGRSQRRERVRREEIREENESEEKKSEKRIGACFKWENHRSQSYTLHGSTSKMG